MSNLPKYELTVEGVDQALADLDKGGSEDVAIRLEELGIQGQTDNTFACPVARYLHRVVGGIDWVQVGGDGAFIKGVYSQDAGGGFMQPFDFLYHAELPDSVSAFVEDFDNSVYPQLVEPVQEVSVDADA